MNGRRVVRKVPEAIEGFQDRAAQLLKDRHHGVLLGGVTLIIELCSIEPALIPVFQEQAPLLCKILRSLLMSGFMPEHDVGGITDPFLQVKVRFPPFASSSLSLRVSSPHRMWLQKPLRSGQNLFGAEILALCRQPCPPQASCAFVPIP